MFAFVIKKQHIKKIKIKLSLLLLSTSSLDKKLYFLKSTLHSDNPNKIKG